MLLPDTLPLHLNLAMMRFLGSSGVWPNLSATWPLFPPSSPMQDWADAVAREGRNAERERSQIKREQARRKRQKESPNDGPEFPFNSPLFTAALQNEAFQRAQDFAQGLAAVAGSDYTREETELPVLWQRGEARLLDYAPSATSRPAVLVVPSLINRSYVLDLEPDISFMRYLASRGFRPVLLDWGTPGPDELEYGCAEYVSALALDALTHLRETHDGPIVLSGYCMGGVFALAMAQLAPIYSDGLILLATPWDFSSADSPSVSLPGPTTLMLRQFLSNLSPVPSAVINMFFHLIDPWAIQQRYAKFPHLPEREKRHFLAIEHWLNDGVPLARTVAIETFVDWPQANALHTGTFKIGRKWIAPEAVKCPSLVVIPANDRIVPASCAEPLTERLSRCDVLTPTLGHVSMVASERAKEAVWKPIADWIQQKF